MFFNQLKDVDKNLQEILKHDMSAASTESKRFQFTVVVVGILMFSLISIFDYLVFQEYVYILLITDQYIIYILI